MCPAMTSHDATFYLQVEPEFISHGQDEVVRGIHAVALTQKRPRSPKRGTVLMKLTVRVPDAAFLPLRPEVVIVVPQAMTEALPIEVTVGDPHG